MIYKAKIEGFLCAHNIVSFGASFDGLYILTGGFGQNKVKLRSSLQNVFCCDLYLCCLTLCAAQRLVYHDLGVGQAISLALRSACC